MESEENSYKLKIEQRHKNYVEYYERVKPIKRYSLTELMAMSEMELLSIMPSNQCVDEHSEKFGWSITKYVANFDITKGIQGDWHIGYHENHRDKMLKDQATLFEITYVKNLKIGLIDLFLMVQNRNIEIWSGIKSGRVKLLLGDSWDDRVSLGLN